MTAAAGTNRRHASLTSAGAHRAGVGARPTLAPDWVSVGAACALLGVTPATLRRWADAGEIAAFTTPGGHRRFARPAIDALLPARPIGRPDLGEIDETSERIALRYRDHARAAMTSAPWLAGVPAGAREPLREHGRVIAASLVTALEAPGERERDAAIATAEEAAREYGRISGTLGASMRQTVAAFLRFRRPFVEGIADVARRRELDSSGTAALLGASTEAMDRLLDATLAGHEAAAERKPDR